VVYKVSSSEKLRKTGADSETKALLFLMNFSNAKNEIHYFIIDFFNDVTGMNSSSTKLWDVQSKGKKSSTPKEIGRELVTLFKNYLSDFDFDGYGLFLAGVSPTFREDKTKNIFGFENVSDRAKESVKNGLKEESEDKTYIDSSEITNENINGFLNEVLFIIDDKTKAEYIKEIIKEHPKIIADDDVLETIFEEIKKEQSNKKDMSIVEGIEISSVDEVMNFYRHLTNGEIKLLTLQRIINRNPVAEGVPIGFMPFVQQVNAPVQKDVIEECKRTLISALFNKNASQEFWELFAEIYSLIVNSPTDDVQELFNKLDKKLIESHPNFDILSTKYFIAVIKEGIV